MNTKHPQITAETRQNIMTAFWQLYRLKPLAKISVSEIMATAGYNRGTFYHYFTDIYQVLDAIEDEVLHAIQENILNHVLSSPENLLQHSKPLAALYTQKGIYLATLLGENGDPAFLHKFINLLRDCFSVNLSPGTTLTPQQELAITFSGTAILYSFMYWYQHQDQLSPETAITTIQHLLKNGCFTTLQSIASANVTTSEK